MLAGMIRQLRKSAIGLQMLFFSNSDFEITGKGHKTSF
jgi:hypothetical protein